MVIETDEHSFHLIGPSGSDLTPRGYGPSVGAWCYTPAMHAIAPRIGRLAQGLALLLASTTCYSGRIAAQMLSKGVVDLDGRAAEPFQNAGGKLVVLLFIRTDCPISNRYAPYLQQLSARYAGQANFLLIYPIRTESSEQVRRHMKDYGYRLPALRDPEGALVRAAQVKITPEAAVFTPKGQLLYHGRIDNWYAEFGRARSAPTTHELTDALDAALAGKPVPVATAPGIGCFLPDAP